MDYYDDYPTKPIGGDNPYSCCAHCGISDPQINGRIEGHAEYCEYRIQKEREFAEKAEIERRNELQDSFGYVEGVTVCGDCGGLVPRDDAHWGMGRWWHNKKETCEAKGRRRSYLE